MIATPHRPEIVATYGDMDEARAAFVAAWGKWIAAGAGKLAAELEIMATANALRDASPR